MTVLRDKLTDAARSVSDGADEIQSRAKDAWDTAHYRTNRAVRKSSTYLHKNPVPTALTAFGFGLVLGTLLSRRSPGSSKERYIAQPSRGVPFGLIIACITLIRSIFFSAGKPLYSSHMLDLSEEPKECGSGIDSA